MSMNLFIKSLAILVVIVFFSQCKNREVSKSSNLVTKDTLNMSKKELSKYFDEQQKKLEKKYDSLNIKGDSTKNKSTITDIFDTAPIYNETTNKKK